MIGKFRKSPQFCFALVWSVSFARGYICDGLADPLLIRIKRVPLHHSTTYFYFAVWIGVRHSRRAISVNAIFIHNFHSDVSTSRNCFEEINRVHDEWTTFLHRHLIWLMHTQDQNDDNIIEVKWALRTHIHTFYNWRVFQCFSTILSDSIFRFENNRISKPSKSASENKTKR